MRPGSAFCIVLALSVLVTTSCAIDGSGVVSGAQVNERIRRSVIAKVSACYPGDAGAPLLYAEVRPRYDDGQFYQTKDVNECLADFDAIPCASLHASFGLQAVSLYIANIYAFVCPGLSDKEFFNPHYLEGNFPEASSSSTNASAN